MLSYLLLCCLAAWKQLLLNHLLVSINRTNPLTAIPFFFTFTLAFFMCFPASFKIINSNVLLILFLTVIVTSSNSTDETIVADSDVEMETATSNPSGAAYKSQNRIENISADEKENTNITNEVAVTVSRTKANVIQPNDTSKAEASKPTEDDVKVIDKTAVYRSEARDEDVRVISKVLKDENLDISRDGACDIIFSQDLVVKRPHRSAPAASTEGGVNFKRFRKVYIMQM